MFYGFIMFKQIRVCRKIFTTRTVVLFIYPHNTSIFQNWFDYNEEDELNIAKEIMSTYESA